MRVRDQRHAQHGGEQWREPQLHIEEVPSTIDGTATNGGSCEGFRTCGTRCDATTAHEQTDQPTTTRLEASKSAGSADTPQPRRSAPRVDKSVARRSAPLETQMAMHQALHGHARAQASADTSSALLLAMAADEVAASVQDGSAGAPLVATEENDRTAREAICQAGRRGQRRCSDGSECAGFLDSEWPTNWRPKMAA